MIALSSRPFCPCDGRRVSLGYLAAGLRYTTMSLDDSSNMKSTALKHLPLWKRYGIKHIAHDAVSSCLVSPSLSQNIWEVSRKVPGGGSATCCRPRDHIQLNDAVGVIVS